MTLNQRSRDTLKGVHPYLVKVAELARTYTDFTIIWGLRTRTQQLEMFRKGASKLNGIPKGQVVSGVRGTGVSRHQSGHAIDVVLIQGGKAHWTAAAYTPILAAFRRAAIELGVPVTLGADWKRFVDMPHIELNTQRYPA
jgi:peptidoglycan L-alanyl-D-glutamate endopeptidase CwlK